jgi:hypothetical protein
VSSSEATIAIWARLAPTDFLATAASELNGTSETATYGPPYNTPAMAIDRDPGRSRGCHGPCGGTQALRDRAVGAVTNSLEYVTRKVARDG